MFVEDSRERTKQIGAAYYACEQVILQNEDTLDSVVFHRLHDFVECSVLGHADDISSHDVFDLAPVRLHIFFRDPSRSHKDFEPAWPLPIGRRLTAAQEIPLGQDPDDFALVVQYWETAHSVVEHQVDGFRERGGMSDGNDTAGHHIRSLHRGAPLLGSTTSRRYERGDAGQFAAL